MPSPEVAAALRLYADIVAGTSWPKFWPRPEISAAANHIRIIWPQVDVRRSAFPVSDTIVIEVRASELPKTLADAGASIRRAAVLVWDHELREILKSTSGEHVYSPHESYGRSLSEDRRFAIDPQ
jgi:hypothetical protein